MVRAGAIILCSYKEDYKYYKNNNCMFSESTEITCVV